MCFPGLWTASTRYRGVVASGWRTGYTGSRTYLDATLHAPVDEAEARVLLFFTTFIPYLVGEPTACTYTQLRWLTLPVLLIRASELARAKVQDQRQRERDEDALDLAIRSWAREQEQRGQSQVGAINAAETTTGPMVPSIVGIVRIASVARALPFNTIPDASTTALLEVRSSRRVAGPRVFSCRYHYVCSTNAIICFENNVWDLLRRKNQPDMSTRYFMNRG